MKSLQPIQSLTSLFRCFRSQAELEAAGGEFGPRDVWTKGLDDEESSDPTGPLLGRYVCLLRLSLMSAVHWYPPSHLLCHFQSGKRARLTAKANIERRATAGRRGQGSRYIVETKEWKPRPVIEWVGLVVGVNMYNVCAIVSNCTVNLSTNTR